MINAGNLLLRAAVGRPIVLVTAIVAANVFLNAPLAVAESSSCVRDAPPSVQFEELFRDVQMKGIFHDSKTFADVQYDESADAILADYRIREDEIKAQQMTTFERETRP